MTRSSLAAIVAGLLVVFTTPSLADVIYGRPSTQRGAREYPSQPNYWSAKYNWSGLYVGGHVAYGHGKETIFDRDLGSTYTGTPAGFFGGAQVGFNIQQGSFVWGVETDYTFGGLDRGPDLAGVFNGLPATIESHLNNVGTVRARLGIAIDRTMVYATAGGAWGGWRTRYKDFAVTPILIADNSVQWGWVAGGGIEHALTDTITLRLEGLYTSFDHQTVTVAHSLCGGNVSTPCKFEFDHDFWTLRLGLNYKFKGTF